MPAWETKDIIVVASAVSGFAGTVIVQLLHPWFAARRERAKIVEGIRGELYQKIILHLNEAIGALMEEDGPSVRKAFDALDEARNIYWPHEIIISEDFRRACGMMLYKAIHNEYFEAHRHNNRGDVTSTVDELIRVRSKLLAIARKELKIRQSLKSRLYAIVSPVRKRGARLKLEVQSELKHWLRKLGFYRLLNRFR
jgi:hypothetical protein